MTKNLLVSVLRSRYHLQKLNYAILEGAAVKRFWVAVLLAVGYAGMAHATIYEWVENGIDTYSDSPPSNENGMGGHYHGPYTEGGVQVSISRANPEVLADNAASNAEYKARQEQKSLAAEDTQLAQRARTEANTIVSNEAKFGAESGSNGIVAGYSPRVMTQASMLAFDRRQTAQAGPGKAALGFSGADIVAAGSNQ